MPVAYWFHAGCILVPCRLHTGSMPVAYWFHAGCILVPCRLHTGCILVPYCLHAVCMLFACCLGGLETFRASGNQLLANHEKHTKSDQTGSTMGSAEIQIHNPSASSASSAVAPFPSVSFCALSWFAARPGALRFLCVSRFSASPAHRTQRQHLTRAFAQFGDKLAPEVGWETARQRGLRAQRLPAALRLPPAVPEAHS
jgi:hypothetical protein